MLAILNNLENSNILFDKDIVKYPIYSNLNLKLKLNDNELYDYLINKIPFDYIEIPDNISEIIYKSYGITINRFYHLEN